MRLWTKRPPMGRGRGLTMPAWMKDGAAKPLGDAGGGGLGAAAPKPQFNSVEEALAVLEKYQGDDDSSGSSDGERGERRHRRRRKHRSGGDRHRSSGRSSRSEHKHKHRRRRRERSRER